MAQPTLVDKLKGYLRDRRRAYLFTFQEGDQANTAVLEDLARFCRASESTFHPDPRLHAVLEGRREVWLRIQHHLRLKEEDLWRLYGKEN